MRKYEFLFFDLDNTLWDFSSNSREALKEALGNLDLIRRLSSFDDYFLLYEQINESLWADYRTRSITKQALIVERFSRSLEAFDIVNQDWKGINGHYLECMALQTKLFPGTRETLVSLKAKGYQMHIITNGFSEVQRAKLQNSGLAEFFGKVFISEEVKAIKPHRKIFEYALKSGNALKKKSIMIGDSWDVDIIGAREYGIDQIMVINNGHSQVPEPMNPLLLESNSTSPAAKQKAKTYIIKDITGLTDIL